MHHACGQWEGMIPKHEYAEKHDTACSRSKQHKLQHEQNQLKLFKKQ